MERFGTAVRSSTLARLVNGDRAVTVCERSLGCTETLDLCGWLCLARGAGSPAWL